jgi:DNA-directed RNA polymerase specialized sigma24 family protein
MVADEPRLFSTLSTLPVDLIAPQHEALDSDLVAWGRWSRERRARIKCGSAEGAYRAGYRSWHYPTAAEMMPSLPNPRAQDLDRAILRIANQHRELLRMHYVDLRQATVICRQLALRWETFGQWMFDARAMVINQLRVANA